MEIFGSSESGMKRSNSFQTQITQIIADQERLVLVRSIDSPKQPMDSISIPRRAICDNLCNLRFMES